MVNKYLVLFTAEKKREVARYSPERYVIPEYVPHISIRDLTEGESVFTLISNCYCFIFYYV